MSETATVEKGPQPPAQQPRGESCPSCGAPAEPGQLACVSCGARLRVRYRRPPSWRLPAAIVAGVLVLLAVGAGFGLREIASEAEIESSKESATPPQEQTPQPPTGSAAGEGSGGAAAPSPKTPPEASPSTPPESAKPKPPLSVQSWPGGASGYTAILVSHETRAGAFARARDAVKKQIPAGVLRSTDHKGLRPGFWVVYAGRTPSREKGERLAAAYARKGFPGAYTRFVGRKK